MKGLIPIERIERAIFLIRGQRVILDADLARLYGVPTFRFNEAFKRNRHRFPADFAFQLSSDEFSRLTSQIAMSNAQPADSLGHKSSQAATSSRGGRRHLPWAFTEHGALM